MALAHEDFPFDISELATFLAVCEAGSMTGAARRLGVTQPAVSIAIGELERKLLTPLLDRSVRPLGLTPAGVLLRQRASALLSEARQIKPMLRDVRTGRLPLIRVGLVDSLARALSSALVRAIAGRAEEVAILSGLTASHASALITRNLDVMVGLDDLADVSGLERWPILTEAYVLVVPPGAPRAESLEDLEALGQSHEFVRFSARSSTGIDIERHLRRIGLDLQRRLEFDAPHGAVEAVREGGRFSIVTPLCLFDAGAPAGTVDCRLLPGPAFRRSVTLVSHRAQHGDVPRRLAEAARAELRGAVAAQLAALSPLLAEALVVAA